MRNLHVDSCHALRYKALGCSMGVDKKLENIARRVVSKTQSLTYSSWGEHVKVCTTVTCTIQVLQRSPLPVHKNATCSHPNYGWKLLLTYPTCARTNRFISKGEFYRLKRSSIIAHQVSRHHNLPSQTGV